MSGFVCPNCSHQSHIFPGLTGGAKKMCENYQLHLLGQIPLDPKVLIATEKGKSVLETESEAAQIYNKIVDCNDCNYMIALLTHFSEPLIKANDLVE